MKTFGYIAAVPILLGLCQVVSASEPSCYVRRAVTYPSVVRYQASNHDYYNATYYQPASISLGYQPDQSEAVLKALDIIDRQGQAERAAHERESQLLKALIASGGTAPLALKEALAPPHPGQLLARQDCARCHSAEDKAVKGGKHIFFRDGELVASGEETVAMMQAVAAGSMPKDRPWNGQQKYEWLSWLTTLPPPGPAQAKAGGG